MFLIRTYSVRRRERRAKRIVGSMEELSAGIHKICATTMAQSGAKSDHKEELKEEEDCPDEPLGSERDVQLWQACLRSGIEQFHGDSGRRLWGCKDLMLNYEELRVMLKR